MINVASSARRGSRECDDDTAAGDGGHEADHETQDASENEGRNKSRDQGS